MRRQALENFTPSQANSLADPHARRLSFATDEATRQHDAKFRPVPRFHEGQGQAQGLANAMNSLSLGSQECPSTPVTPGGYSNRALQQQQNSHQQQQPCSQQHIQQLHQGSRACHSGIPLPPQQSSVLPGQRRATLAPSVLSTPESSIGFSRLTMAPPDSSTRYSLGQGPAEQQSQQQYQQQQQHQQLLQQQMAFQSSSHMPFGPPPSAKRMSLAASSHTTHEPKHRQSLAGSSVSKTGSSSGRPGQAKADPRKVGSKAQQLAWCEELLLFLHLRGYDRSYTAQQLMPPTSKDFLHLFQFIMSFLDPGFSLGASPGEEVYQALKRVGYPFPLSKANLGSISPHNWPPVLAMLAWLVQHVDLADRVAAVTGFRSSLEWVVEDHVGSMYACHLRQDDAGEDQAHTELGQTLEQGIREQQAELDRLQRHHASLREHLQVLETMPSELETKLQERDQIAADALALEQYGKDEQARQQALEAKRVELKAVLAAKASELEGLKAGNAALKQRVDSQRVKLPEFELMLGQRRQLEEQLRGLNAEVQELQQQAWAAEVDITREKTALQDAGAQYTALAKRLGVLPQGAKRAGSFDYELNLDLAAGSWHEILGNRHRLKGEMREWLKSLAAEFHRAARESEGEAMATQAQIHELRVHLGNLESAHAEALRKIERMDHEMELERERSALAVTKMEAEMANIANETNRIIQAQEHELHMLDLFHKQASDKFQEQATKRKLEEEEARRNLQAMQREIKGNIGEVDKSIACLQSLLLERKKNP